jgi:NTE family protein
MIPQLETKSALVLAGGGVAGIAWETGILLGLREEIPALVDDILSANTTLIGTSAGSTVAANVANSTPLEELYAAQIAPETAEITVEFDVAEFMAQMASAMAGGPYTPEETCRRVGAMAKAADTPSLEARHRVIEARLPIKTWPKIPVWITVIDADSGELEVFDANSGVSIVNAVEASCAVPEIWPVVPIGDHWYIDGGSSSVSNARLAAGAERALILVPAIEQGPMGPALLPVDVEALSGTRVHVVYADEAFQRAVGVNPLDAATRIPGAAAGVELGRRIAREVSDFWYAA